MFASTDSLSMRVVSCEAITAENKTILLDALDAVSSDRRDTMRSMPSQHSLLWLGHLLLDLGYVPESVRRQAAQERLKTENPDFDWSTVFGDSASNQFFRPIRESDPGDAEITRITHVKLRWWRVTFDGEEGTVRTIPMGEELTVELRGP